jgi:hypothetical protein
MRDRGGWFGPWPGRGPLSYLPPWERPGWILGRGAYWRLPGQPAWYGTPPSIGYGFPPYYTPSPPPEEEHAALEEYKKDLEEELKGIEARIEELKSALKAKET